MCSSDLEHEDDREAALVSWRAEVAVPVIVTMIVGGSTGCRRGHGPMVVRMAVFVIMTVIVRHHPPRAERFCP